MAGLASPILEAVPLTTILAIQLLFAKMEEGPPGSRSRSGNSHFTSGHSAITPIVKVEPERKNCESEASLLLSLKRYKSQLDEHWLDSKLEWRFHERIATIWPQPEHVTHPELRGEAGW